jgi:hypothetical protein
VMLSGLAASRRTCAGAEVSFRGAVAANAVRSILDELAMDYVEAA